VGYKQLMRRGLPVYILLLPFWFISAQKPQEALPQPSVANISIGTVEGDGAINSIRLRRAHEPVVRVVDSGGEPLAGATVTFLLPATGASGSFLDGGLSLTTETDSQGRAVGRGLRPNSIAGQFRIRVTASWSGSEAAATLVQTNAEPAIKPAHSKTIAIVAIIAGAVAGGAAIAARGKSNPADSAITPSVAGGSISPGAPSLGPPH
jgi:hypothetical protein